MKTKGDLDPSEATAAHAVITAGFLPTAKIDTIGFRQIVLRVRNCLYCKDFLVGPDEKNDLLRAASPPKSPLPPVMPFLLERC